MRTPSVDERLGFSVFVRDEIHALPDLLELVRPVFDEIVVLHTGEDNPAWRYLRTLEQDWWPQVRPYRLNIPFDAEHFHFGYARSTAAHLNKCGYVMMLDVDERMSPGDLEKIRDFWHPKALENRWPALAFPRRAWRDGPAEMKDEDCSTYPDWQIRMIRNDGTVWWRRAVHEACLYGPASKLVDAVSTTEHINHFHGHYRRLRGAADIHHILYLAMAAADEEWIETFYCIYPGLRNIEAVKEAYAEAFGRPADIESLANWCAQDLDISDLRKRLEEHAGRQ